jgi:hypothetical protein
MPPLEAGEEKGKVEGERKAMSFLKKVTSTEKLPWGLTEK